MNKLFVLLFLLLDLNIFSQTTKRQSYFGLEFGIIEARTYSMGAVEQKRSLNIIDGISAGATLRKHITKDISLNTGYSFRVYELDLEVENYNINVGNAYVYHTVPICFNYEKPLYKDKIQGFISLGCSLGFDDNPGQTNTTHTVYATYDDNVNISIDWKFINDNLIDVFYLAGFGSRVRFNDELFLELGLKYNLRFLNSREYLVTLDYDNEKSRSYGFKERNDYLNFNIGLSFSFQKTLIFVKKGISKIDFY